MTIDRHPSASRPGPGGVALSAGQTLVVMVLFMLSVLGMAAFAIDVGIWYQDKRDLQNDADAAVLAAAASLPTGTAADRAAASFAANRMPGESMVFSSPSPDSVRVTTSYPAPAFFAKVFGHDSVTIIATATAQMQAAGAVRHHVSPYVVTVASYDNGRGTTLFNCDASGQCGTIDLPTATNTSGGSCSGAVYTGTAGNVQAAILGTNDIGQITAGGCLSPKTGNAQPSANSVNTIPGDLVHDLSPLGNGQYEVIRQSWDDAQGLPPRLIFVPIVPAFASGTNATMTVQGFAWFYITGATGNGNGLRINGQYVSMNLPSLGGNPVAWVPGRVGQVTQVAITG